MTSCENCGAEVPVIKVTTDGKLICCAHCLFHPLVCRCRFGEFGKKQEYGDEWPDDVDPFPGPSNNGGRQQ